MFWRAFLRLIGRATPAARSATALTQRGLETARRIADAERIIAQATTSPAMRAFAQGQLRALQRTMAEINAELARRGAARIEVPIMSP